MSSDRTYNVSDPAAFKRGNLANWQTNSQFWLQGGLRHQSDVAMFTAGLLKDLLGETKAGAKPVVMDYGCGDGWVYPLLQQPGFPSADYIGFDFNPSFVEGFRQKYGEDASHRVVEQDFEVPFPAEFQEKADVGVNFFNFFEIPLIDEAFKNVCQTIKPGGYLVVVTLDPVLQLLAVSTTMPDFRHNLKEFERYKEALGYDKDIDANNREVGRIYKAITYSLATYIQKAKSQGFTLRALQEVNRSGNPIPQIYQYLVFRKPDLREHKWWEFFWAHPMRTILPSLILGAPLLLGAGLLMAIGYGRLSLETLHKLENNDYAINSVLMVAIGVGHAIVVLSLFFYTMDISTMRGQAAGAHDKPGGIMEDPRALTSIALRATTVTLICYALYLGSVLFMALSGSGNFRYIIESNKFATIIGFLIFWGIDSLVVRAKRIENRNLPPDVPAPKRAQNENEIHFSRCSTFLINIPTLLVTALIWALIYFLHSHPEIFRQVYDPQVGKLIKDDVVNWNLFLDGLETGAIVATLICSQVVFAIIKVRYHYRVYWLDRTGVAES